MSWLYVTNGFLISKGLSSKSSGPCYDPIVVQLPGGINCINDFLASVEDYFCEVTYLFAQAVKIALVGVKC